jgi:hypothetical protein
MNSKQHSERAVSNCGKALNVLGWCLPALLGFAAFLSAFPIDSDIPFWSRLSFAEVLSGWFLLASPVAIAVAIFNFAKYKNLFAIPSRWFLIATMSVAIFLNAFVLIGLYFAALG